MTRKRICENWQASVNSGAHAALYVIYEREIAHGPRHDRIRLALVIYISTTTSITDTVVPIRQSPMWGLHAPQGMLV